MLTSCNSQEQAPKAVEPQHSGPKVHITTNLGDIVLELYPDKAPKTVENFLQYVPTTAFTTTPWIDANPYAWSVNWSCTMEAALRILSWTWFFRVFHASRAWADPGFRERFLCSLYLHGDFTERHLEHSDVNGNHCTADAAGLVFAGLFFGSG